MHFTCCREILLFPTLKVGVVGLWGCHTASDVSISFLSGDGCVPLVHRSGLDYLCLFFFLVGCLLLCEKGKCEAIPYRRG